MLRDIEGISGYVTVRVASRMLGISQTALQRRIQRGTLPALRIERTLLVKLAEVRLRSGRGQAQPTGRAASDRLN